MKARKWSSWCEFPRSNEEDLNRVSGFYTLNRRSKIQATDYNEQVDQTWALDNMENIMNEADQWIKNWNVQ